jgi:hypothetical protein
MIALYLPNILERLHKHLRNIGDHKLQIDYLPSLTNPLFQIYGETIGPAIF